MKKELCIKEIRGREILDSRGRPTLEAEVTLTGGITARGCVPSGASTGTHEALELRDGDPARHQGKGVLRAAGQIQKTLSPLLQGMEVTDPARIDRVMIEADGTPDRSRLGANALLAVSIAVHRAAAAGLGIPLFRFLGGANGVCLPVPMMNILNGGAHAANTLDTQEFMILPVGAARFSEALRMGAEVYHSLAGCLKERGLSTAVGDEGGFAPDLSGDTEALELLLEAIQRAGYRPGADILLGLDAAASEWKQPDKGPGHYRLPKSGAEYTSAQLIDHWKALTEQYPICSIEDGLDEEDWAGWKELTRTLGQRVQLVGDDLFVTNAQRLACGIQQKAGNAILIKPNQVGTLTETMEAVRLAQQSGYGAIASHRSGETEDTTIADLAVGLNTCQIKTGAPCRSERVAKYNRLLRIEDALGDVAVYPGAAALKGHC